MNGGSPMEKKEKNKKRLKEEKIEDRNATIRRDPRDPSELEKCKIIADYLGYYLVKKEED